MRRTQGFSLIEMLVAMVILSISLGVLYQAAAGATRNARVAREYSEAAMVAESVMSEFVAVAAPYAESEGSSGEYRWQVLALPVEMPEEVNSLAAGPLMELTVRVSWGSAARARDYELLSYYTATVESELEASG